VWILAHGALSAINALPVFGYERPDHTFAYLSIRTRRSQVAENGRFYNGTHAEKYDSEWHAAKNEQKEQMIDEKTEP
jgi:hypothetical protein